MSFSAIVRKTWEENHLFSVLLELTYRCNLDCVFCYNDVGLEGRPLALADYERLLEDLAGMQVLNVILSGGEPLAHPHFFELGSRARELGFVVRVKSNGHALRGTLARRLQDEVDPFLVEVSLHGACAETHDRQTRVAGSFARLTANLEEMRDLGLRIKINSTLTRWNEGEIGEMMDLADALDLPLQFDPEVTPRDDGDVSPLELAPSREGLAHLFQLQRERAASASDRPVEIGRQADTGLPVAALTKHCGAGSSTLAVDPYGNVYPCVQWRRSVGNLHERSVREIWETSTGLEDVRDANVEVKDRLSALGPAGSRMGFCPGTAVARTGASTGIYAAARERADILASLDPAVDRRVSLPVLS